GGTGGPQIAILPFIRHRNRGGSRAAPAGQLTFHGLPGRLRQHDGLHASTRSRNANPAPICLEDHCLHLLGRGTARPYFCLMTSISRLMSTSSPTTSPPLSRTLLHFIPKSCRLILPCAVNPARVFPIGSFGARPLKVPVRTTSLFTPSRVRSPFAMY